VPRRSTRLVRNRRRLQELLHQVRRHHRHSPAPIARGEPGTLRSLWPAAAVLAFAALAIGAWFGWPHEEQKDTTVRSALPKPAISAGSVPPENTLPLSDAAPSSRELSSPPSPTPPPQVPAKVIDDPEVQPAPSAPAKDVASIPPPANSSAFDSSTRSGDTQAHE
jgi:hypothetical protein